MDLVPLKKHSLTEAIMLAARIRTDLNEARFLHWVSADQAQGAES